MTLDKRSVLITGCSDGGLGAALAIEFHKNGFHVYATARNPSKMKHLASRGVETLTLDVLDDASIKACVAKVPSLDILVNNAGAAYPMPIVDMDIVEAKKLFDLNVWSCIAVTQAFMPALLEGTNAMVVNNTSLAASSPLPFNGAYNPSKAALAMFTAMLRMELEPFGITAVDLRTGQVLSNFGENVAAANSMTLPPNSIYNPAREVVEKTLRQEGIAGQGITAQEWAKGVVKDLMKSKPPAVIWRGKMAWIAWLATMLPDYWLESIPKKMARLDVVEQILKQ